MPPTRSALPDRHPAETGLHRIEVMGRPDDRQLLRRVALALAAGDGPLRAHLAEVTGLGLPPPSRPAEHPATAPSALMDEEAMGDRIASGGSGAAKPGLGTRIATLFAGCPLEDVPEFRGAILQPPDFTH